MSPFPRHHQSHVETRTAEFGKWLFDHTTYKEWQNSSSSSILLLHGIPGSGETALCSSVADSFFGVSSLYPSAAPIAYFYCSGTEFGTERTFPDEIMRSILRQLAVKGDSRPSIRELLLSEFERRSAAAKVNGFDMPKLLLKDCVKLILNLTELDPVVIIVDAIDEVPSHNRFAFLDALRQIAEESANVVKIFATTRNDTQVFPCYLRHR